MVLTLQKFSSMGVSKLKILLAVWALLAAPAWAEDNSLLHRDNKSEVRASTGTSLKGELAQLGLEPPPSLSVSVSQRKHYPRDSFFGGSYYLKSALKVPSFEAIENLSEVFDRCSDPAETKKALVAAWEKGEHEVPLTTVLPTFVCNRLGKGGEASSNCWNTTLNFHGCTDEVGYTPPEDIQGVLDSPAFEALKKGDQLKPGDVVAIYSKPPTDATTLQHTAVYVGGDVFFHKGSIVETDPYAYEKFADVVGYYRKIEPHTTLRVYRRKEPVKFVPPPPPPGIVN